MPPSAAEVAASIAKCGGTQALVSQLTSAHSEQRAAAAQALHFLGRQGPDSAAGILKALAQHAAACRLPARPLLAFWRFWEQPQQAALAGTSSSGGGGNGGIGSSNSSGLSTGREAEWESLALLLHMLAGGSSSGGNGSSGPGGSSSSTASSPTALALLEATATAVPAVLAHAAAASRSPAVRFAAFQRSCRRTCPCCWRRRCWRGSSRRAAAGATAAPLAARQQATLLWELVYSPAKASSQPAAVEMVQQHAGRVLPALEAALHPQHPAGASLAAGLLACLLFEPPHIGNGRAAAAADGTRHLLASRTGSPVLQRLVGLLQADAASNPQSATLAALAVANLAAYRGAAVASADRPAAAAAAVDPPRPGSSSSSSSGAAEAWQGLAHHRPDSSSGLGRLTAKLTAAVRKQAAPPPPSGAGALGAAQEPASPPAQQQQQQPTDPRGALLYHGAMPLLLRLVINCSALAAATGSAAQPHHHAVQRGALSAALQALNNLCADPAAAAAMRAWGRSLPEEEQHLTAALAAAMGDRQLDATCHDHARLLLRTQAVARQRVHLPSAAAPGGHIPYALSPFS